MLAIIKKYMAVLFGSALAALSLDLFLIPGDIAPGGISGISIILHHLLNIPVGISILALNIPILFLGLKYFSTGFVLSSLIGMTALSAFTEGFSFLSPITGDLLLSAVYGGALMGVGLGIVFSVGASTGGTDIGAQILKKKFPSVSVGRFVLIIDAFIVFLAGLTFGKWEVILYSSVALYVCTYIIDLMVEGIEFAKVAYIISDKSREISKEISDILVRGTTALKASSHFTDSDKTVLMCVVKKYQISKLKQIIKNVDPNAFVILSDTREVLGNGFNKH